MVKPKTRSRDADPRWSVWEQIMPSSESKGIYADATQKVREMKRSENDGRGGWKGHQHGDFKHENMVIQLFNYQKIVIQSSKSGDSTIRNVMWEPTKRNISIKHTENGVPTFYQKQQIWSCESPVVMGGCIA